MAKEHIESCGKYTTITTIHAPRYFAQIDKGLPTDRGLTKTVYPKKSITHMGWQEIDDLERIFRAYHAKTEVDALWNLFREVKTSKSQKSEDQG